MSDRLRGEISRNDAERLDLHLQACPTCREAYETDKAILQRVAGVMHWPSEGLVAETMDAVRAAAAAEHVNTLRSEPLVARGRWVTPRTVSFAALVLVAAVASAVWWLRPWAPSSRPQTETPRIVAGGATDRTPVPPSRPGPSDPVRGRPPPEPDLAAPDGLAEAIPVFGVGRPSAARPAAYGTIAATSGGARMKRTGDFDWRVATEGGRVRPGDTLKTGADGTCQLRFGDGTSMEMATDTEVVLGEPSARSVRPGKTSLLAGITLAAVLPGGGRFEVWTRAATAEVQGTEFVLSADEATTVLAVLDGSVVLRNDTGRVTARAMEQTSARVGWAPSKPQGVPNPQLVFDWRQGADRDMSSLLRALQLKRSPERDSLVAQAPRPAPEPRALDRTNAAAVARAYVEACREGDMERAIDLLNPDDPFRDQVSSAVAALSGERESPEAPPFSQMLAEVSFFPVQLDLLADAPAVDLLGDGAAEVTVTRSWNVGQHLVMTRGEDGTWAVDLIGSIKATTGSDTTLVEMESERAASRSADDPYRLMVESERRLRTLARGFEEYAREHGNRLPPATKWVDAIEPYVLDKQAFRCPAAPEQQYGYAMNAEAGELVLPSGYEQRQELLLLFESRAGARNASASPQEAADMQSFYPDGTIIVVHAGADTLRLPSGTPFTEAVVDDRGYVCLRHLDQLTQAAREYAFEHAGVLPGPDTWQDDIAPYLPEASDTYDDIACPSAEGMRHPYAINAEVAGKNARELVGHDEIVLFFESDLNVPNASGHPDRDGATPARHRLQWQMIPMNCVRYLNGGAGYMLAPEPDAPEEEGAGR